MTLNYELHRIFHNEKYTIGKLYENGVYICDTIEDTIRDYNKDGDLNDPGEGKVYGKTAIPFGTYEIKVTMSPKFKRFLPRLLNVKHFEGILIHNGKNENSSSGCIIVGENKIKGEVINSTYWMNKITDNMLKVQKQGLKIFIKVI